MPSSSDMERKFNAAVNVIRGLPKNGSYQPSNDMMLRFYSFYKQATLGSCTQQKPAFWDVVGRAKYDAYKALGNMPKERAMELYVEELKKIIETMSYTDNVEEFMGIVSDFQGADSDDMEPVAPEAIGNGRSNSSSRSASRDPSPVRIVNGNVNGYANGTGGRQDYSTLNGSSHIQDILQNGHSSDQHSDDEYIDTVEDDLYLLREPITHNSIGRSSTRRPYINIEPQIREITTTTTSTSINAKAIEPAIHQILRTIESMHIDLQRINSRIDNVERSMADVKNHQLRKKITTLRYPRWWPFSDISPNWFLLLVMWPFLARQLARMLQRKSK